MLSLAKKVFALTLVGVVAGCVSIPVDQLHIYNGMVTAGGTGNRFEETPVTSISQKDRFFVITHVSWDNPSDDAGTHTVKWQWYSADKLVAERSHDRHFKRTPYRFWYSLPASDFAVGHYRVDILIDDKVVDTQQFDITQ